MGKLSSTFILASGGSGQRFQNSRVPKQYLRINKIPILMYSLTQVNKLNFIDEEHFVLYKKDIFHHFFLLLHLN